MTASSEAGLGLRQWLCATCGYIYDEAVGEPGHGIPPGTRFEDLPEDWICPDCGVGKEDFRPLDF